MVAGKAIPTPTMTAMTIPIDMLIIPPMLFRGRLKLACGRSLHGVSGGLIPCPAALVVPLASLNSGEIASGMSYLLMFSLGVAVVLMTLGLVVSKATDFASRYL